MCATLIKENKLQLRRTQRRVIKHGLFRCVNRICAENMILRRDGFTTTHLWNRDLAACLNMLEIIYSLRNNNNGIPTRFQRRQ
ncbi:hypothetical protein MFLAVUS_011404 [Mucor flavus]|uniref:Uncharacterized protein n=1 Tax=Mucor flavus TaxID=439312 RepID=A0ABP9ZFH2_9FUNG